MYIQSSQRLFSNLYTLSCAAMTKLAVGAVRPIRFVIAASLRQNANDINIYIIKVRLFYRSVEPILQ